MIVLVQNPAEFLSARSYLLCSLENPWSISVYGYMYVSPRRAGEPGA